MRFSAGIFRAADYLRLSKEDGDFSFSPDKRESDSISSQRELIQGFVSQRPDIELVAEFVDDGFTGTNFDRPGFQKMMEAIERGEINCVIVKDLSRFGREYIDAGNYIEKMFPRKGVRFIAVNERYDSLSATGPNDSMIVSFINLLNDSYSRDISIKIRTNLATKRQRGEFISNFAVYGYMKDPDDKNRLIIDPEAASVVREIFRWKIEGVSPVNIAQRLNERGTLCPAAYKKAHGSHYTSGFWAGGQVFWNAVSVQRILTNEVYCGVLIQGRRTTANYKVKTTVLKSEQEWARVEGAHEAIITHSQFHVVQRLMNEDCRRTQGEEAVRPLSGRVYCGDCGSLAKRAVVSKKGRKYAYYICPNSCKGGHCAKRRISEEKLEETVLSFLRLQIGVILDIDRAMEEVDALSWEKRELRKLDAEIEVQEEEVRKNSSLKVDAYEDFRENLIDRDDLKQIRDELTRRIRAAEDAIRILNSQKDELKDGLNTQQSWLAQFRDYGNIDSLTRAVVVTLIDRILLFPDKRIRIILRNQDQIQNAVGFLRSQNVEISDEWKGVI